MQVIKSDLIVRPSGQSSTGPFTGKVSVDNKRRDLLKGKKNGK